jgi:hypothetical protein
MLFSLVQLSGIILVDFKAIDLLQIRYSTFGRYWRKWKYNGRKHQLSIYFKKFHESFGTQVFIVL